MGLDLTSVTAAELLACAPRLEVQLVEAFLQAVFWYLTIRFGAKVVEAWTCSWSASTLARWTRMNQVTFKKSFMVDFDEADTFRFACAFVVILLQHGVGGGLCLPAVFGLLPALAPTLACHGALCEVGWEVQDYIVRWCDILFGGPAGKARQPVPVMIIMTLHHAMGTLLVVPMNLHFRDNAYYHELVFLLQAAAVGAMGLQQYGYTLDIRKTRDLITMKILVSTTAVLMLWSRLFRYCYVVYCLLVTLWAEGGNLFHLALLVAVMMGLLNLLFVNDAIGKFVKFMFKSTPVLRKQLSNRQLTREDLSELSELSHDALSAGIPQQFRLSKAKKEWAKLRGLHRLGLLKNGQEGEKKREC